MKTRSKAKWISMAAMGVILLAAIALMLTGCAETKAGNRIVTGKDVQTFTYAYIRLGDKDIVEGYITQWRDYDDCDEVQLLINGKYYLTHYSCVVMVADPSQGALQYSNPTLAGD